MWIDDQVLAQRDQELVAMAWVPTETVVVLGSSNDPVAECHEEHCSSDHVKILRRYGGGGAVVLYPGCVILSIGCWVAHHFENARYFRALNESLIHCIEEAWPSLSLNQAGISDITCNEKKIAGTSMFRSRNYLLYQASILVDLDIHTVQRYLKHPSREPAYRLGRPHGDFLVGLQSIEPSCNPKNLSARLSTSILSHVKNSLGADLISAQKEQFTSIDERLERARES